MGSDVSPRNRAERRFAGKKARAAGAALTAGSAALAMGAAWIGPGGIGAAGAAPTLHVTSLADSGGGTLRDQLGAANDGDTIVFDVTGTITLTSGQLQVNDDVTITGPGAASLTIDGNDADRIMLVGNAAVSISGLTFTNGSSSFGGAIYADSASALTISGSVFTENESSGDGGAITSFAAMTVTDTVFDGNHSQDLGGAIFLSQAGATTISDSTFVDNTAGFDGGAVDLDVTESALISNTTFERNKSEFGNGGAVAAFGTQSTISGSTFVANGTSYAGGGAVEIIATDVVDISGSTFSENSTLTGDGGGAIGLYRIYGEALLDTVTITGNTSNGDGGGGVFGQNMMAGFTIRNSTISGNDTDVWGGGLYLDYISGTLQITGTTIAGNVAGEGGGGVMLAAEEAELTVVVTDSTISGNQAGDGGGGWIQWDVYGTTTFANSTISGNTTANEGGGIYFYGWYGLSVEMSTITDNEAGGTTGGVFLAPPFENGSVGAGAAKTAGEHGARDTVHAATRAARVKAPKVHAAALGDASFTGNILWGNTGDDLGGEGAVSLAANVLGTVGATIDATDAGGNLTGVDPLLGPLANNGGPTQTHELLAGSPAINAGPDPVPSFPGNEFDQRGAGFPRVADGAVDIGAFEVQPATPSPAVIQPRFTG